MNALLSSLLLFFALASCGQAPHPATVQQPSTGSQPRRDIPYQRFVPASQQGNVVGVPWAGFFALDTKTGQLCLTVSKSDAWDKYKVKGPPTVKEPWNSLPVCNDILIEESHIKILSVSPANP